jgi:hypothetical protein
MDVVPEYVLRTVRPGEFANELRFFVVGENDAHITMGPIERHSRELESCDRLLRFLRDRRKFLDLVGHLATGTDHVPD